MKKPLKIENVWENSFRNVIIPFIQELTTYLPGWTESDILSYFSNEVELNYGGRWVAPIVYRIKDRSIDPEQDKMTPGECNTLGKMIYLHYRSKWDHLSELWQQEYDPLHNYLDVYTGTKNGANTQTGSDVSQLSGSNNTQLSHGKVETKEINQTETRNLADNDVNRQREIAYGKTNTKTDSEVRVHEDDINENIQTANWIAGYNSTGGSTDSGGVFSDRSHEHTYDTDDKQKDYVQSGNVQDKLSGKDTETWSGSATHTGTVGNTGTDTIRQSGSDVTTETFGKKDTRTINNSGSKSEIFNLTHKGNIGNIYTQDMFMKDLELWKVTFQDIILHDILDYMSLGIY